MVGSIADICVNNNILYGSSIIVDGVTYIRIAMYIVEFGCAFVSCVCA